MKRLPFKPDFLSFKPDPGAPPIGHNECLNIDPRMDPSDRGLVDLMKKCPFRLNPELSFGRKAPTSTPAPAPDLVVAAHQSAATAADELVHAVTIRNIGNGVAEIGSPTSAANNAGVQFYASMNPLLDGQPGTDYVGAGGWMFVEQQLSPGGEIDISFTAGTGSAPGVDFRNFNYVIAQLIVSPPNDQNTGNNLSIVPILIS